MQTNDHTISCRNFGANSSCGACYAPGYSDTGERRPRTMAAAYADLPAKARALMAKRAARP